MLPPNRADGAPLNWEFFNLSPVSTLFLRFKLQIYQSIVHYDLKQIQTFLRAAYW